MASTSTVPSCKMTVIMSARSASSPTFAQRSWSLYNLLILFRVCVAPFLPGYVHPDEFFQGGQELWFGCPPARPWEFEPENALRSVVPPTIMTWLPLKLCSSLIGIPIEHLSGWYIWIIPRVACAIVSIFAVDLSVWALARADAESDSTKASTRGVPLPVLMVASAWPTMVLLNRPFTNAMETWIIALLLRVVFCGVNVNGSKTSTITLFQCLAVGALSALGIFTRFTFVCFAFPTIVFFGYKMIRQLGLLEWLIKPAATVFTFYIVATNIMQQDKTFYSSASTIITPWNALSYNSNIENLKDHGLHPRWTHALVNMFILFGPMALMGYALFGVSSHAVVGTNNSDLDDSYHRRRTTVVCSKWTLLIGLGILSMAPHQEPRFLLPLLVPLALLSDNHWMRDRYQYHISTLWIVFNCTLLVLFGMMHQSGVVPSLLVMGSSLVDQQPKAVIFYHTYMPPTFLSRPGILNRQCSDGVDESCRHKPCKDIPILDLDGSNNLKSLQTTISEQLQCDEATYVHVVSSPVTGILEGEKWYFAAGRCNIPGYACEITWNYNSHLSTEDFPSLSSLAREGLPLSIYKVSCLADD